MKKKSRFNLTGAFRNPFDGVNTALERMFPVDPTIKRIAKWKHGKLPRVDISDLVSKEKIENISVLRPYDRKIGTSIDIYELVCINSLVKQYNPKIVFEIGTYDGNTTINIASNSSNDCQIYTLDLPPKWNGSLEKDVPDDYVNVTDRKLLGRQISYYKDKYNITQIFEDSAKFDWNSLPNPLDLIFIDGNHYYEYVKQDTENALKYINNKGCIIWHDYGEYLDVSNAVDEISGNFNIVAVKNTRLAVATFS
ncbi:MAG: class I SAM-dependent methyltransferase [Desulfobacula sp.]|nr:class I SAM-dependent methyltransferase [Desulfobacula sp.]